LGSVAAFYTVTVKSRIDGQLVSVGFNEGEQVREGQLLVSIDPRPYQIQLDRAQSQLAEDQALLADARRAQDANLISQLEGRTRTDQANIENAKLRLIYTEIRAPIAGVAGLRLVDPGNIVHAADSTAIVTITQLQPIAVVFNLAEDALPQVRMDERKRGRDGGGVEPRQHGQARDWPSDGGRQSDRPDNRHRETESRVR
jgi:multidrug efflux system membrane fusion protein